MDTASARPRALKLPVGRRPSSLTQSGAVSPSAAATFGVSIKGVSTSPRETTSSFRATGNSSRHFQNPASSWAGRAAMASRSTSRFIVSRS